MLDLPFRSAKQLASAIKRKKIGCAELLDLYLARVEKFNPKLNAIIAMDIPAARKRAKSADTALARGKSWGPLHGVPMTLKESFNVTGLPTTWGVPALKDNIATSNAVAADRFVDAGAVVFGKTNVPIYLADWQSYNAIYGTTNNPWDVTRTPGGSSGGSGAALAAGLTALDAGSDIGSSIRNPAHYNGVYGHKPTWGICTPRGHAVPGSVAPTDISAIGPLARSAEDIALALSIMAGPDEIDGAGWKLSLPAPRKTKFSQLRIAVMLDDPNAEVDREVQDRVQAVADFLAKKKAKINDKARPDIDTTEAQRNYITLLRAATSARLTPELVKRNEEILAAMAPDDDSYLARMTRGNLLPHRDWLKLNNRRHQMRLKWAEFFKEWDLLICPVASSAAFPHDQQGERHERLITVNNKRVPTTDQLFWAGFTGNFYLPSISAPAGFSSDGLPIGVQIVGAQYDDRQCIELARMLEQDFQGFVPPPGYE
jgi:amidase